MGCGRKTTMGARALGSLADLTHFGGLPLKAIMFRAFASKKAIDGLGRGPSATQPIDAAHPRAHTGSALTTEKRITVEGPD